MLVNLQEQPKSKSTTLRSLGALCQCGLPEVVQLMSTSRICPTYVLVLSIVSPTFCPCLKFVQTPAQCPGFVVPYMPFQKNLFPTYTNITCNSQKASTDKVPLNQSKWNQHSVRMWRTTPTVFVLSVIFTNLVECGNFGQTDGGTEGPLTLNGGKDLRTIDVERRSPSHGSLRPGQDKKPYPKLTL